ncbi:MAG TPA: tetratricopeptide repeat protein [Acetobacteraceae bacterium]|nr:tetratricopeptide repeat protein [Acetobacteraceae bacterium]
MAESPGRLLAEAQALHGAGRLPDAARRYEEVLKQRRDDATALALLGALRLQQGDALAASKLLRRAADLRPADPTPRYNLGVALNRLGRHAEAADALDAVTAAHPDHADAWKSLGDARRARDDLPGALAAWRAALGLRPDFAGALLNLGATLLETGEVVEAEERARQLIALRPQDAQGHNNLGLALYAQGRLAEAEAAYRRSLELAPEHDKAMENLGRLLTLVGRLPEAIATFRGVIELQRRRGESLSGGAYVGLLMAQSTLCEWTGIADLPREVLARENESLDPFILLAHDVPGRRLRRIALLHGRKLAAGVAPLPSRRPRADGPITLGYLSADFRDHAVASLLCEALEWHDRERFAVHAYATRRPQGFSRYRRRIAAAVTAFHEVEALGDDELARRIIAHGVDILVDLGGWTADHRMRMLALRPAPVQATWLGFAASVGVPWVDYAILDPVAAPPGCEEEFSEHIVRLPESFQPNDRARPIGAPPSRAAEGLPESGFVFAAFASAFKITPRVWDAWMRIVSAVPGSVLWLRRFGEATQANLRREAEARGVSADRLVFAGWVPDHAAHLARYRIAGLALDTWPYGSHTTASDALWTGCPLIALRGETLATRISSSVLTAAGLPDLITNGTDEFVALAVRLATSPDALAALRARVEASRGSSLFDTPRLVRHLEAAYRAMHERAAAGLPPAPITIAPLPREA